MKSIFIILIFILSGLYLFAMEPDYLVMRSEYENIGDNMVFATAPDDGIVNYSYSFISGNEDGYFEIRPGTGLIRILNLIPDQIGIVTENNFVVEAIAYDGSKTEQVTVCIVDMYDYLISTIPHTELLDKAGDYKFNGPWTAYNNLWGIGNAVPNHDFRIGILINDNFPAGSVILWDVPGQASSFNGASVWNFSNFFMGNREGMRTDVAGFPFNISDVITISLNYDIELIVTNSNADTFKLAMNTFLTNENYLAPFTANDGDFFFVPDQLRTYIPSYPISLPDININGKTFAMLYKDDVNTGYQWRRVIIKNEEKLTSGPVDLLGLFNIFADNGYLDKQQHIYHLMFGIEVTEGFGAYRINNLNFDIQFGATAVPSDPPTPEPTTTGVLGDVNNDSIVNILDALLIAQYYVGLTPVMLTNLGAADVNCNESVDIIDSLLIAQFYVGLINQFC